MQIAIKVQHLRKSYKLYEKHIDRLKETLHPFNKSFHKEFHALREIGFEIKKGEVVGIIGRNGSGKSTLLKILTGVLTPSDGSVRTRGKIAAILELGAGFNPELNGIENIYLNMSINGFSKIKTDAILDDIVTFSELGEFIYQPVKTYSSGMKSKLAFAVSISLEPEILIIDEALSVGDAAFQRKSFAKIEAFKEQGKTILFVSHSASQIVELCDRAIWIHKGELILDGKSKIVTGLYQKFGLGHALQIDEVREEYRTKLLAAEAHHPKQKIQKVGNAFYNPNLRSSSMIEYAQNGAHIHNIQVLDMLFKEVNVLVKGEEYYYSYDIVFQKDLDEVRLAMMLKTKTGIALGGKEIPLVEEKKLQQLKRNKKYTVKWKFENMLNAGHYFFNCGVNHTVNGEKVILHRIIDAYMIEVVKEKNERATSMIDFSFDLSIEEN